MKHEVIDICRLCEQEKVLQNSHIVPRLVYARVRQSSSGGGLLNLKEPQAFIQDGGKTHLLCSGCEQKFSRDENEFASKILDPYLKKGAARFEYGEWGLRFGVSVVWRVLVRFLDLKAHTLTPEQLQQARRAEVRWRLFLRGKRGQPGSHSVHAMVLEDATNVCTMTVSNASPYAKQHATSITSYSVIALPSGVYVYVKMMQFYLIGFIHVPRVGKWRKSEVKQSGGVIDMDEIAYITVDLLRYINTEANDCMVRSAEAQSHRNKGKNG